jgi:hypothetical protein
MRTNLDLGSSLPGVSNFFNREFASHRAGLKPNVIV